MENENIKYFAEVGKQYLLCELNKELNRAYFAAIKSDNKVGRYLENAQKQIENLRKRGVTVEENQKKLNEIEEIVTKDL